MILYKFLYEFYVNENKNPGRQGYCLPGSSENEV